MEPTRIESALDVKTAIFDEIRKLYLPNAVTDLELFRTDFWNTHVFVAFSVKVGKEKKMFHAKVDRQSGHVADLLLTSAT